MSAPYYQDEFVTLYHGDCCEVMTCLEDGSVDLTFTSPPYNLGNSAGGGMPGKNRGHYPADARLGRRGGMGKWSGGSLADGYDTHDDAMPHGEYVEWQHRVLQECWRLTSQSGAIFYNHKPRIFNGEVVTPLAYNPGLPVRQIVIWKRAGGVNFSPSFYLPTSEWIVVFAKSDWRLKSKGASGVGDVWDEPQETGSPHPAPFPIGLPARAIETTTAAVILDPFSGSGTTLRAAKDAGRRAIGIEASERWCEYAARRLDQLVLDFGGAA